MRNILINQIMAWPVITVQIDEPFSHVEEKFRQKNIRHLPVVDSEGKLLGLITQRDLFRTVSPHKDLEGAEHYDPETLDAFILKRAMISDPSTLGPDDTLLQAVELMASFKYGCIPIVDKEKKVIGIVTEIDVLKLLYKFLKEGCF